MGLADGFPGDFSFLTRVYSSSSSGNQSGDQSQMRAYGCTVDGANVWVPSTRTRTAMEAAGLEGFEEMENLYEYEYTVRMISA